MQTLLILVSGPSAFHSLDSLLLIWFYCPRYLHASLRRQDASVGESIRIAPCKAWNLLVQHYDLVETHKGMVAHGGAMEISEVESAAGSILKKLHQALQDLDISHAPYVVIPQHSGLWVHLGFIPAVYLSHASLRGPTTFAVLISPSSSVHGADTHMATWTVMQFTFSVSDACHSIPENCWKDFLQDAAPNADISKLEVQVSARSASSH
jgi:hypothetical protein